MRIKLAILSLIACTISYGTVTIELNSAGFSDSGGTATNDMNFGLVFNTGGAVSFNAGSYDAFDITSSGQFLNVGGIATDDYYVFGTSIGVTEVGPPISFLDGYASYLSNISYGTITTGDQFGVIWFESKSMTVGDNYGFYTDAGLLAPADPSTVSFSAFIGDDIKSAAFTAVPEPAEFAALFGIFALGLVLWRRRK